MSDYDGYASSSMLFLYLKKIYGKWESNITWNVHPEKEHGIKLKELDSYKQDDSGYDFDLLIIPDAGSGDYEEHKKLSELGVNILILDHHIAEKESEDAVVINPQLSPNYPNKQLCGATVVYKFLQAMDNLLKIQHAEDFIDLAMSATIADVMDTKELENRYLIQKGLSKITNPFMQSIIEKQSFSIGGKVDIKAVGWHVSPLINAVTRVGTYEERFNTFKAFTDFDATTMYKKRGEKEARIVPLYEDMARQIKNIKTRQDRLRDKIFPELMDKVNKEDVINIIEFTEDPKCKNLKGVLAMRVADKTKKPTLMYVEREYEGEIVLQGSGRNADGHFIEDFRQALLDTGLMKFVEGHDNAFGFSFLKENLHKVKETLNKKYKDAKVVHKVDFKIPHRQLTPQLIKTFDNMKGVWGTGIKEPVVLIQDVLVEKAEINDKGSLLSIKTSTEIEYKTFYPLDKVKKDLTNLPKGAILDVVGIVGINEWKGDIFYQVIIQDYEIKQKPTQQKETAKKDDFFF